MSTIVLIEDNPSDREIVKFALQEASIEAEVLTLTDGEKGVSFVALNRPELCPVALFIVDINLPRISGHVVLDAIRNSSYQGVPVIVMTSSRRPQDSSQELLGTAHYFRKPVDLDQFLAIGPYASKVMLPIAHELSRDCKIPA